MLKKKYKTTPLYLPGERAALETREPGKPTKFRALTILAFLFRTFWRTRFGRADDETKGKAWRYFFESLGGLWVKVGQILAMRTDLYEKGFTRELSKLSYRVTAFPPKYAAQIIEDCLGQPLKSVFSEFDENPIAAASLAQVHVARLAQGDQLVAVKVQRPYAQEFLKADMAVIKRLFNFFNRFEAFKQILLDDMFWELETMLTEEVDFRYEATNLEEAKKRFKKYGIYVPKVYKRWSNDKVVVMEFVEGITMSEFIATRRTDPTRLDMWLKKNKIKPKKVGSFLLRNAWRQVLEDNYFHGDLQPGNIMLLAKNKVAFIDLGSVGSTDDETLSFYRQQIIAIGKKEYAKAAEFSILTSTNIPRENYHKIRYSIVKGLRGALMKASLTDVDIEQKTTVNNASSDMAKELAKYKVAPNWGMLKLIRLFLTIDPSVVNLHPKLDLQKEWLLYFKDAKWRMLKKKAISLAELPNLLSDAHMLFSKIQRKIAVDFEGRIGKAMEIATFIMGKIKLAMWAVLGFFAWSYFYQHFKFLHPYHQDGNWFTRTVERMPSLGWVSWLLIIVVTYFFISSFSGLIKRIKEPAKAA
ncbi:MAG: ABC1 kinase family protein [Saprospiraceae bacterium]